MDVLRADHVLEFPYTRSTGPVVGAFFGALKAGRILGARTTDGKVIVPPLEHDPWTAADIESLVEVSQTGTVASHSAPFALVKLDGADTPMLARVQGDVSTGDRVHVRWSAERIGDLSDIECFVAGEGPGVQGGALPDEIVNKVDRPVRLEYEITPGLSQSVFLRGMIEGRIVAQRCPRCKKVYVPPRGSCPLCGVATQGEIELSGRGTVTTFCVVNIAFAGQSVEVPYVCASVLLDGADLTLFSLVRDIPTDEVRPGLRVEAVWAEQLGPSADSIAYFRPIDEPDTPLDDIKDAM